jgi:hypothetical protein
MSQLSRESKDRVISLLESCLELYQGKKFQKCLKKYDEVLGIINPTDDNAIKAVLFALISQVHIKIAENESSRLHTSDEIDLLKLFKPTDELSKTKGLASKAIEDTESGSPELPMNSGQIEDPPVGIVGLLIKIFRS